MPTPLRPAAGPDSDHPDTHLGRAGDSSRLLVPERAGPVATEALTLVGAASHPDFIDQVVRTVAMLG